MARLVNTNSLVGVLLIVFLRRVLLIYCMDALRDQSLRMLDVGFALVLQNANSSIPITMPPQMARWHAQHEQCYSLTSKYSARS